MTRRVAAACAAAGVMACGPALATIVNEIGDAGQTQGTAQITSSVAGPTAALTDIFGRLSSGTDADLYIINIFNPAAFSATTVNATGGFLDTQLFLFTLAGAPVYINDDDLVSGSFLSTLPAGNAAGPVGAGRYILGVANAGYDPVNAVNQLLFASSALTTDVRGPASGLQPGVLGGYSDDTFGFGSAGDYRIQLTGAGTAVPEPTSFALAGLALALCASRTGGRRRAPSRTAVSA